MVVQGSQLSAILYLIYTNKIPKWGEIIRDRDLFNRITNNKIRNIYNELFFKDKGQFVLNYIDESTNIICHNDSTI